MQISHYFLLAFALGASATLVNAGPLTEAEVTKIINDVRVIDPTRGARRAALQDKIKDEVVLKTGLKSRSELVFQDQTLTRIGPETSFSFAAGARDMTLEQGTLLLQVPKGLGGTRIRTAAVTAAITGTTIMMEYRPKQSLKVLVLEGSLRLSLKGSVGDSLLLLPGKMVIMPPNAKRIPDPVSVDLAKVMKTSSLVKMSKEGKPLPSLALIDTEIAIQEKSKQGDTLVDTNLVIQGNGTKVVMTDDAFDSMTQQDQVSDVILASNGPTATPVPTPQPTATPSASATPGPSATPTPGPSASPTPGPSATPTPGPSATPTPGASATPTPGASATPTPSGSPVVISSAGDITISTPIVASAVDITAGGKVDIDATINTGSLKFRAGKKSEINATITAATVNGAVVGDLEINDTIDADDITFDLTKELKYSVALVAPARNGTLLAGPSDGRHFTIFAKTFDVNGIDDDDDHGSSGSPPITLNGGDAASLSGFAGGSGGELNVGTTARPIEGPITVSAPIMVTTGRNGSLVAHGGDGGSVGLVTTDKIVVDSDIKVSNSAAGRASRSGGKIVLDSRRTNSTAIEVNSSAQLLSLLSAAAPGPGGSIKITSAGGEIKMNGTARADRGTVDIRNTGNGGLITLKTATLHGDVVKVGALGNNGTLTVDGGNISADSAIKLYAGGSNGTVEFKDNVTLSGTSVKTIYGHTVSISDGKVVTVSGLGPAQVFTNNPNYTGSGGNGSTSGVFGGQGATTQPLSAGPGY